MYQYIQGTGTAPEEGREVIPKSRAYHRDCTVLHYKAKRNHQNSLSAELKEQLPWTPKLNLCAENLVGPI